MSVAILLRKDLLREGRGKEALAGGAVLVVLFMVLDVWIFPELRGEPRAATAVLWTPLVFGAAAVAGRGMASEMDRGTLEWIRSLPVGHGAHGLSRTIVDLLVMFVLAVVTVALAAALFGILVGSGLILIIALGVIGLGIMGSLAGGLAAHASAREVLLPILLVPVVAPLLLSGVKGTIAALAGATLSELAAPLLLMAGYDIVAAGVAVFLWPVLVEGD